MEGQNWWGFPSVTPAPLPVKLRQKNRSTITKFVEDRKECVLLIIGRDLIQEDLDDLQGG